MNKREKIMVSIIIFLLATLLVFLFIKPLKVDSSNKGPKETLIISLIYQPKQCVRTPWEIWYDEGNINFIKAPTQEELITTYYSLKYNIEFFNISKGNERVSCEACDVCDRGYDIIIQIDEKDKNILINEGFKEN